MRCLFCLLVMGSVPTLAADTLHTTVGWWRFENDLKDSSAAGHHARLDGATFAPGRVGRALAPATSATTVPNAPTLQLFPGLTIECWLYLDRVPDSYVNIVSKDSAYLLRIDHPREGGRISFFAYLNGWEPRVRGPVPAAGKWTHIIARWTGKHLELEANGSRVTARRSGTALPSTADLVLGAVPGRLDEVRILNPGVQEREWALAFVTRESALARITNPSFGNEAGWPGWHGARGTTLSQAEGHLVAQFAQPGALLVNGRLDIDVTRRPYVLLDLRCPSAASADLLFVTETGYGILPVQLWASGRTAAVLAGHHPNWRGQLKLLALSPRGARELPTTDADGQADPPADTPDAAAVGPVTIESIRIAERMDGKPFLYVRNLSPGRAILRAGREEEIAAVIRNLGGPAPDAQAVLELGPGLRVLDTDRKQLGELAHDATMMVRWRVSADEPMTGTATVRACVVGSTTQAAASVRVRFEPDLHLPEADYVPRPQPAESDYMTLMHYCPLWKFGTHYGWNKIELWPERKPAIGFYDEGTPEVADWHIKYALEHGIRSFIYCWYRATLEPDITENLGHALHDGLLHARYLDMFNFCIMWENGCAKGVKDRNDMMDNLFPYWMKHFFTQPSYLKVDNKPVLFVWRPERVSPQLGGVEATREVFTQMRAECRAKGFDGLWIIGCVSRPDRALLERMAAEGWDASSAYATWGERTSTFATDPEGLLSVTHRHFMEAQKDVWLGKRAIGALPDIVNVMMGWDKRPWFGRRATFYTRDIKIENFETALREAKTIVDATPGNGLDKRMIVLDNWDEFGEGHYLEPCAGFGFGFVDAVRRVLCHTSEPCTDITPEDVGLEPPDRVYRKYREIMFGDGVSVNRKVRDHLIAWWQFDGSEQFTAYDSSACGFDGFKHKPRSTTGVRGNAFRCDGGSVTLDSHPLFFPLTGITVELWMRTETPDQSDKWMVNTVARADSGYRLGLSKGRLTWQIPQGAWTHGLVAPDPAPLGRWNHVAATYDNEVMRLYADGKQVAEMPRTGVINPAERDVVLGSYAQGMERAAFRGDLDEVRIYDRPLSAAEIRARSVRPSQ